MADSGTGVKGEREVEASYVGVGSGTDDEAVGAERCLAALRGGIVRGRETVRAVEDEERRRREGLVVKA